MGILEDIGAIGPASNPYGTPSVGQWNLARGVYTNSKSKDMVFFFEKPDVSEPKTNLTGLESITDSGGRRLAIYEYPYLDGQKIADLGRKGETFSMNITFWGLNYQNRLNDFISLISNDTGPGHITHPIRGTRLVRYRDHEFIHKYDAWNSVTIKAVFVEDNTATVNEKQAVEASPDSKIRTSLQTLISAQAFLSGQIFAVQAALLLPAAVAASMSARLTSITGQMTRLIASLGATFSSNKDIQLILTQILPVSGGITEVSSGTVNQTTSAGNTTLAKLPPVFQVGFTPSTNAILQANIDAFIAANQITPQKAVFLGNQARQAISAAITEINDNFGNDGYDMIIQYRVMATSLQDVIESSLTVAQSKIKKYIVNSPMSLRMVAKQTGLDPERQNDIAALNPYISSVNYIPEGTVVIVPAS